MKKNNFTYVIASLTFITLLVLLSSFRKKLDEIKKVSAVSFQIIYGGILPHHLLAEQMINDFFIKLSKQKPETIILIGPNHFEKGDDILSSDNNLGIRKDDEILEQEISITNITPIIKKIMPDVKIVPIIFKNNVGVEQLQKISENLSEMINSKTVLVASIDFSHYLNASQAEIKDGQTIKAIENKDLSRILSFDSNNLDSPASLFVLLSALKNKKMHLAGHFNSAQILQRTDLPVVSYMEIMFY